MPLDLRVVVLIMSSVTAVVLGLFASKVPGMERGYEVLAAFPMLLPWLVVLVSTDKRVLQTTLSATMTSFVIGLFLYWRYTGAGAAPISPQLAASLPLLHAVCAFGVLGGQLALRPGPRS